VLDISLGVYHYANGGRYEGEYTANQRNGNGVYYYANGERYEGEWRNDKQHGKGKSK